MNSEDKSTNLPGGINTNTYVSIGLVIAILGVGYKLDASFKTTVNEAKDSIIEKAQYSINMAKSELANRQDKIESRMKTLEDNSNSWTYSDMFKWAVHLQRENDGTNGHPKVVIPEPEQSRRTQ